MSPPAAAQSDTAPPVRSTRWQAETWIAICLTVVVVAFHAARLARAGGLWRDEAAVAQLATLPSIEDVFSSFPHEAFPAGFFLFVRGCAKVAGDSDTAWRVLGALVGLSIVGALWLNMWILRRSVPLLSLALLGFNGAFIQWGDSLRGYGPGVLLMLLTVGLVWAVVKQPAGWRVAAATLAAVGSVQCLLGNAVLLLAICLGAAAVTLRRRAGRQTLVVLGLGLAAAVSLLPYAGPVARARQWDVVVRWPVSLEYLGQRMSEALSGAGWWGGPVWAVLLLAGLAAAFGNQRGRAGRGWWRASRRRQPPSEARQRARKTRDLRLFGGTLILIGTGGYACFLKVLGYPTEAWYYLPPMALAAMSLDLVFDTLKERRGVRVAGLALVLALAALSAWPAWRQVRVRQTNVDLVAAKLRQAARPDDLIVVTPWYNGISFARYYRGAAPWRTVPPIEFHQFHRYDLIKDQMTVPDQDEPIQPLLDQISQALGKGHRVWVVGAVAFPKAGEPVPQLPPAPDEKWGWYNEAYVQAWSQKVSGYLQARSRRWEKVTVERRGDVNSFEDLPLTVFEGG